jgi:Bacterial membrane protein YfhO
MTPSSADAAAPTAPTPARRPPRTSAVRRLSPAAGPLLIVASVLIVTHGFWLENRLSREHVDLLSFWLPRWCAMGKGVFAGHVPTWLPNQFGGVPFASDPQSGWAYLPVMLLFGLTSCSRALGLMITLNPLLAGLGMYWFFRGDRLSRPAATSGGLVMALAIAGSVVALSMPFAGALAWTAVALAGLSHLLHARRPSSVVGWLALTALAWSQIAAAHLTHGLLMGSALMALYALARLTIQVRSGERSLRSAAVVAAVPVFALPFLSAAVLYPRLKLLPRTSIGQGYLQLGLLTKQLGGFKQDTALQLSPLFNGGIHVGWGTGFARGSGSYVGAATILLIAFGIWSRRWRLPALAFALCGFVGWGLNMDRLIRSGLHTLLLHTSVGELWLRDPARFRYVLIPAFAALGAYGLQAWLDAWSGDGQAIRWRTAAWLVGGSVVVFVVAPLIGGGSYVPFAIAVLPTAWLLWLVAKRTTWAAAALPALLAVELTVTALAGQTGPPLNGATELSQHLRITNWAGSAFRAYHTPWIPPASYATPGAIGRILIRARGDGGRYLTFDPKIGHGKGFLFHQAPSNWPAYQNGRSVLFGLSELQGYSPVQLMRYWTYLRALDREAPIYYNSATFQSDAPNVLDLFGVEWVIQLSSDATPPPGGTAVATEGKWTLWRISDPTPRASLVPTWHVVSATEALHAVLDPAFPQRATVVLERVPTANGRPVPEPTGEIGGVPASVTAGYRDISNEHGQVHVSTTTGGVVLIRNPWDENWHATVDGTSVPLLHADYVMQGVAVPAGDHTVDLSYRDPGIGWGLWISAIAWILLLAAYVVLRRRERRELSRAAGSSTPRSAPPAGREPLPAG